jgi:DNA ligase 4
VFSLQEGQLEKIIQQAQGLGSSRIEGLQSWRTTDGSDFVSCVERVLATTDCKPRHGPDMTLEELDNILDQIAAMSVFLSISLREKIKDSLLICIDYTLSRIFRALKSSEAKWIVCILSKNYSPVCIPESLAIYQFYFLLPDLLKFQNSFAATVKLLDEPTICCMPFRTEKDTRGLKEIANNKLKPQVGLIVMRPTLEKARSIKYCCQLASRRQISIEQKYNSEYCQIYIDLNKVRDSIKIFSKSRKDSTNNCIRLHRVLQDSLGLNKASCKIKKQCILEGELLI